MIRPARGMMTITNRERHKNGLGRVPHGAGGILAGVKRLAAAGLGVVLIAVAGCGSGSAPTPEPEPTAAPAAAGTIVLGDVAQHTAKKIGQFQPLADYLAANLGELGIGVGEVKIAPDVETMTRWLATGGVDLYFDSMYPATLAMDGAGAEAILRRWKDGAAEYHTVFFARADSGLTSLSDLRGQTIAFDDRPSTSGYLVPMAHLIRAGLHPVERVVGTRVGADEVGYVFSGDEENATQWVISGRTAAAAIDSQHFQEIPAESRAGLIILEETGPLVRQVVMVGPGVDAELVEAIKTLFTGLEGTVEGQAVLKAFKTVRFDEFPEGIEAAVAEMRESIEIVRGT